MQTLIVPLSHQVTVPIRSIEGAAAAAVTFTHSLPVFPSYGFRAKYQIGKSIKEVDCFSSETEKRWYFKGQVSPEYLEPLKDLLDCLLACFQGDDYTTMEIPVNGKAIFVWIQRRTQYPDAAGEFSVYYNGDYQFHLQSASSGWVATDVRVGRQQIPDERLVMAIGKKLQQDFLQESVS